MTAHAFLRSQSGRGGDFCLGHNEVIDVSLSVLLLEGLCQNYWTDLIKLHQIGRGNFNEIIEVIQTKCIRLWFQSFYFVFKISFNVNKHSRFNVRRPYLKTRLEMKTPYQAN